MATATSRRTRRKRPCSICGRWFLPDPRVGARQKCCSDPSCQKKRRARNQAAWRRRNPDYMRAWRLETKAKDELKSREPPSTPPPLTQLPWDVAKDEFGTKGAEFIGSLGRLLLRVAKNQKRTYSADYRTELGQHLGRGANA
jgi:ferric-dicitrate binding protein FerR (iron transport regulator)